MTNATYDTLTRIISREARGFVQYVGDAYPWTTSGNESALQTVANVVQSERKAISGLTQHLARERMAVPYPGSYPTAFTSMNFLAVEWIVARLIRVETEQVAELEKDLTQIDEPKAKELVQALLTLKNDNLKKLRELSASKEPVAAGSS